MKEPKERTKQIPERKTKPNQNKQTNTHTHERENR